MTTPPNQVLVQPEPDRRRSVFGNYLPSGGNASPAVPADAPSLPAGNPATALARSFVHQWLARAFGYPAQETWSWLCAPRVLATLGAAVSGVAPRVTASLHTAFASLRAVCTAEAFGPFHEDYIIAIGHAARGSCPVNEIEYGDLKADPLFQPHRLADLAAFYQAFGLELGPEADERPDHLSVELEFMGVLAAQEATALTPPVNSSGLGICQDAQSKFLREHLGRWTPAFTRRLARVAGERALSALGRFALAFVESECHRFGVKPGSEDLLLRPADAGAALCEGCGLSQKLPGIDAVESGA
ncbi:MAG: molecular chaperone TorD family protein [Verrucomicrobiales bacterium]|nr:molecular chaperone TorD family protein [Verrucomicrobiales bacterium]